MTKSQESEKTVEAYLVARMKMISGKAYKWVSPGNCGVPDRLCVFPDGRVEMVELKGRGGALTPTQRKRFPELLRMDRRVWVLWSRADVNDFMDCIWRRGGSVGAIQAASISGLLYQPTAE